MPIANVVPLTELVTDIRVSADASETEQFMQRYATGIRLGYAGIGGTVALTGQYWQQRFIKRAAHAGSTFALAYVDRDIHRPAIGSAGPVLAGIGISDQSAITDRDQLGVRPQRCGHALLHLLDGGRRFFERDRSLGYNRA